jgi:hypothetical protein
MCAKQDILNFIVSEALSNGNAVVLSDEDIADRTNYCLATVAQSVRHHIRRGKFVATRGRGRKTVYEIIRSSNETATTAIATQQ